MVSLLEHFNSNGFSLLDHQLTGTKWMLKNEQKGTLLIDNRVYGGIIADDAGLGKTILTCSIMYENPLEKTLIILPTSIVVQWYETIKKLFSKKNIILHIGNNRIKSLIKLQETNFDILITTYGSIYNKSYKNKITPPNTLIQDFQWDRVILDEAHIIKNQKSKIFEAVCLIKSKIRWALTATPIQNSIVDLYNLYKFIGVQKSCLNDDCINILNKYLLLRRIKSNIETKNINIPKLIEIDHLLEFKNVSERDVYRKIQNNIKKIYDDTMHNDELSEKLKAMVTFELILRLRQISIHPQIAIDSLNNKFKTTFDLYSENSTKIDKITSMIKESKNNIIVFCHFIQEMKLIQQQLEKHYVSSSLYHGGMNLDQRQKAIKAFNNTEIINIFRKFWISKNMPEDLFNEYLVKNLQKVLIIQINSGGVGLNLQEFSEIFLTSPDWNPTNEIQAIARAHRFGQKKDVIVHRFILFDQEAEFTTIDQRMTKKQLEKRQLMSNILNEKELLHNGRISTESIHSEKLIKQLDSKDFKDLLDTI